MSAPRIVLVSAATPVVTAAEVRTYLRLDDAETDATINGWIATATRQAENLCGRRLGAGTYVATLDSFPSGTAGLRLSHAPISEVTSVGYQDSAGETVELDAEAYTVAGADDALSAEIYLAPSAAWPSISARPNAVSVAFTAGSPPEAKSAVLLLVGALDAVRSNMMVEASVSLINTKAAESLLAPYRIWAL